MGEGGLGDFCVVKYLSRSQEHFTAHQVEPNKTKTKKQIFSQYVGNFWPKNAKKWLSKKKPYILACLYADMKFVTDTTGMPV